MIYIQDRYILKGAINVPIPLIICTRGPGGNWHLIITFHLFLGGQLTPHRTPNIPFLPWAGLLLVFYGFARTQGCFREEKSFKLKYLSTGALHIPTCLTLSVPPSLSVCKFSLHYPHKISYLVMIKKKLITHSWARLFKARLALILGNSTGFVKS